MYTAGEHGKAWLQAFVIFEGISTNFLGRQRNAQYCKLDFYWLSITQTPFFFLFRIFRPSFTHFPLGFCHDTFFFHQLPTRKFCLKFFFFYFLFFKNFWSTYLSGHSARSARRLESKPAATGLDSSLGYLRETLFSGLKRLDFKPFKPTNWAGTELKAVIHTSLSIII